jgi:hypothetical protein
MTKTITEPELWAVLAAAKADFHVAKAPTPVFGLVLEQAFSDPEFPETFVLRILTTMTWELGSCSSRKSLYLHFVELPSNCVLHQAETFSHNGWQGVFQRKIEEALADVRLEIAWRKNPSATGIPSCPVCEGRMMKRLSRATGAFWGCRKFPHCRGNRDLPDIQFPEVSKKPVESMATVFTRRVNKTEW